MSIETVPACRASDIRRARSRFEVHAEAPGRYDSAPLVAHGHGFSILNQRPAHNLTYDGEQVATIELTDSAPALELVIAQLAGVRLTNRASAFKELCKRSFAAAELSDQSGPATV